jgi:hypothetical protein
MGISGLPARLMAAEHKFRPLPKEIHLLGRQTIHVSLDGLNRIFSEARLPPHSVKPQFDTQTIEAIAKISAGGLPPLLDTSFFEAYGVERIRAIDHSDYEGADIVLDLTKEMPTQYEGIADFIYDGSVMDNVFNPAMAMHNVARLLKPGGRYVGQNLATTRWLPSYSAFNPYWFFDFFVVNGFKDVRVYVADLPTFSHLDGANWPEADVYLLDANADHPNIHNFPVSKGVSYIVTIAEKGDHSTWDQQTSQGQYRLSPEWSEFNRKLEVVRCSKRPVPSMSRRVDRGALGFIYAGSVDYSGLNAEGHGENLSLEPFGEIDFRSTFDGSGWGHCEIHAGIGWRWIDDSLDQSVVLLNLAPDRDHEIEAIVHTVRDSAALYALRALIDGVPAAEQRIDYTAASPKLFFKIPAREDGQNRVRLGFSVVDKGRKPGDPRSVALSKIKFRQLY